MIDRENLLAENPIKIAGLHPFIRHQAQSFLEAVKADLQLDLYITHGFRTFEEQELVYQRGRKLPGNITSNAKPGESYHNYGLAFDVIPVEFLGRGNEFLDWSTIGAIGVSMGLEWGGNFVSIYDRRHFQNTFNLTHQQLMERYSQKNFINGYVNLNPLIQ